MPYNPLLQADEGRSPVAFLGRSVYTAIITALLCALRR